ncbi:hypothetical protein ES708_02151 [subsurface metagenome]
MLTLVVNLARYNLKIIFANKFIYFLGSALFIFLFVTTLNLMNADAQPTEGTVYSLLLIPGILMIFYPITFGIQNDVDNRMIEILFGISNYRYKVWLFRLLLIFIVVFAILLILSLISALTLTTFPIVIMTLQLMFPIMFLGGLAFMVSTIVRNGSGTSVVMVIAGMASLISRGFFENHRKWDVFLNPFTLPENINEALWAETIIHNRIFLLAGIVITILYGLLNLQNREKFL